MPRWEIREAQVDYRLFDTPLDYKPAYGPAIALNLVYQSWRWTDEDYYPDNAANPLFGPQWHCLWSSDIEINHPSKSFWNYLGGRVIYSFASGSLISYNASPDASRLEVLKNGAGTVIGGRVHTTEGQIFEYLRVSTVDPERFVITKFTDPRGYSLTFAYDAFNRMSQITAADGQVTTLIYGNLDGDGQTSNDRVVTQINAPEGHTVTLGYTDVGVWDWRLTSITDAVGILSTFTMDLTGSFVEAMTTPYGETQFDYLSSGIYTLALRITEPEGVKHLYLQGDGAVLPPLPDTFDPAVIPTGLPLSTLDTSRRDRNTLYFGPKQLEAIGNEDFDFWTFDEVKLARIRHWLGHLDELDGHQHISHTLSWEQAPSPDGVLEGQVTWYDYAGKNPARPDWAPPGGQLPTVIARRLPDGTTWYEYYQRNSHGKPLALTTTYTMQNGSVGTRTKTFTYAANGIDLLTETDFSGNLVHEYTYNNSHQILTHTRHPEQMGAYTEINMYDSIGRLRTNIAFVGGMTNRYFYGQDGRVSQIDRTPAAGVESFVWLNGNVRTHTDQRGFTRTFTYDKLNRVTRIDYPGGTFEEFRYTHNGETTGTKWLDLTYHRDRMGFVTRHTYDGMRRRTSTTNPRGHTTIYGYCSCGALESVTVPTTPPQVTIYNYDFQGNLKTVTYPDTSVSTYDYNVLGQLISESDAQGTRTFAYNNQGLRTTVNNAGGQEQYVWFNIDDLPAYAADANGTVADNHVYDWLGRLTQRTYDGDSAVEVFFYNAWGLKEYTDRNGQIVSYQYDAALRKTNEFTPKGEAIKYTYNAAGDLLTLTDGRNKTTTWTYDTEGRLTAKKYHGSPLDNVTYGYDANHRLTSRKFWSSPSVFQETIYGYDANANLLTVDYPAGTTDISYTYDPLDRLSQMVDAVGTTIYTYHGSGNLLSEDGPWASDTVTLGYNNARLRNSLTLQQPAGTWGQSYGYDTSRRLQTLTSGAGTSTYSYVGGSPLVTQISLPNTSKILNGYNAKPLLRFTSTELRNSANAVLNKHSYKYDPGIRRTNQTFTDASFVKYSYDLDNQLTGADASVGTDYNYTYDAGWNIATRNGTAHTVNDLNQVTSEGGGTLNYFYDHKGNRTSRSASSASLTYIYDTENQLTTVHTDTFLTPVASRWRTEFVYDGKQRLRIRKEFGHNGSSWVQNGETRYIYDGMRVIQERNSANTPTVTYTRGLDFSLTMEGAGGIGGLLARSHGYSGGSWSTHNFYHSDASGNITYMINSAQAMVASYKYDPFGRIESQSGSLATDNVYRFSSKEGLFKTTSAGGPSDLYYYGYRFYDAQTGRWLNRDPFESPTIRSLWLAHRKARPIKDDVSTFQVDWHQITDKPEMIPLGVNLYSAFANSPVGLVDPNGENPLILGGAIFGCVSSGVISIFGQAKVPPQGDSGPHGTLDFNCVDWGKVGRACLKGGIYGAIGGAILPARALIGAGEAAVLGGVGGLAVGGLGGVIENL